MPTFIPKLQVHLAEFLKYPYSYVLVHLYLSTCVGFVRYLSILTVLSRVILTVTVIIIVNHLHSPLSYKLGIAL